MKISTVLFLIVGFWNAAFAGGTGDISGGGHGIEINGKVFLLDFVENLTDGKPSFDSSEVSLKWKTAIDENFNVSFSNSLKNLLAAKFSEIEKVDPLVAISIFEAVKLYQWVFVHAELISLSPEETVLKLDTVRQVAVRKGRLIYVNFKWWNKMDDDQKAGLVIHEAVSSLLPRMPLSRERQWVSQFFRAEFSETKNKIFSGWLPNVDDFYKKSIKSFPQIANYLAPISDFYWTYRNGQFQFAAFYQSYYKVKDLQKSPNWTEQFVTRFYQINHLHTAPVCTNSKVCVVKPLYESWFYFGLKLSFDDKIESNSFQPKLNWNFSLEEKLKVLPYETGCFSYFQCENSRSTQILSLKEWLSGFNK